MLTNLNWLNVGEQYPPKDQDTIDRLERYHYNKKLFEGKQAEVYEESFKRIKRVIGNIDAIISYETILNYHKLISVKTADLLYGEMPKVTNEANQDAIDEMIEETCMIKKLYEDAIDVSRFGDGVWYVYQSENGGGDFDNINPCIWFPIVDPVNSKKIVNHVLCYKFKEGKNSYLMVEIHYKGYFEKRVNEIDDDAILGTIIGKTISSEVIQTGLDDFAVQHVSNLTTSDCIFGYDDYRDLDSILSELMVRISQVSKVLDKHAEPSVQGPSTALEKDPVTGEWKLKMGNYFARDGKDDAPTEYITWDAQMESSFKQIELLINQLYVISEMGQILLGGQDKGGGEVSGRALRMKMISPLAKVKRLSMYITPSIKKLLKLIMQLSNVKLDTVSITWQDGLPNDPVEEAEIITKRTGGKPTLSQHRALTQFDGLSEEEAEAEIEAIMEEDSMLTPTNEMGIDDSVGVEEGEE